MTDTTQTLLLCPGQGAQQVGMGKAWAAASQAAAAIFERADKALGVSLSKVCFEGPDDQLNRTDMAQAAIYVTSVACHAALTERGLLGPMAAAAGLSLGEYTALHLAGAFSFEDGLKLVWRRGALMQQAAQAVPSGMVALIGADEAQAVALCKETLSVPVSVGAGASSGGAEVLTPANFNCPGQIVISGSADACQRSLAVAEKMGLRATALVVAGAFHSPLMQPAADQMAKALDQAAWSAPRVPVLSNVTGGPHDNDIAAIKQLLVKQITSPVRWESNMRWALENMPAARFVELAPNKVLMGLMRRIDKSRKVENHAEPQ